MIDKEEKELIKSTRKTIINYIVVGVLGGICTAIILLITIPKSVAQNTSEIKELKQEVKKINVIPESNQKDIKYIQKELEEFKQQYKEDSKETKQSIDELRKQNLKMIELLYQIKQQNN